jgi:AcrR family transcriptional regulator
VLLVADQAEVGDGVHTLGFEGVNASLDDVALAAGVGPGTLYRHFPARDLLVVAVIDDGLLGIRDLATGMLDDADPVRTLLAWLSAYIEQGNVFKGLAETLVRPSKAGDNSACRAARDAEPRCWSARSATVTFVTTPGRRTCSTWPQRSHGSASSPTRPRAARPPARVARRRIALPTGSTVRWPDPRVSPQGAGGSRRRSSPAAPTASDRPTSPSPTRRGCRPSRG